MSDLLILAIALLAVAFLFRVDFIYYIVYVCLGVYITGQLITPRIVRNVKLSRLYNQNAFLGERVKVQVTITNKSWLPIPWLRAVESVPPVLMIGQGANRVMAFRSRESKIMIYQVKAMKRGFYRLGPLIISAGDYFGIRELTNRLPADYLTVFPRIIPFSQLGLPSRLPYGLIPTRHRFFEDPARPIGTRDYHSGDSIRHINWKVSAHSDELLVRTFEPVKSLETLLLLNLNPSEYSRQSRYDGPEWAIVIAASMAVYLAEERQAVGLTTNGIDPLGASKELGSFSFEQETGRLQMSVQPVQDKPNGLENRKPGRKLPWQLPPKPGRAHLMKVLERLARIEIQDSVPFSDWIPRACTRLNWGTNIVAITPTGDEKSCSALHQLVKAGYNPVLIIVEPYKDIRQIRDRARSLGFQAYHVGKENDLDRWRGSHRASRQRA
ncbi:MAG: DUF58 domain-containing protein [Candidatus Promineifilaceae bacterium]